MDEKIRVEFHCHSEYSKDSLMPLAKLIEKSRRNGIDRLAITDHNTINGALAAKEIDRDLVIIGEEILTTQGELLAYFVKETVPANLSPEEAIARLRDQGAFISVAHPCDRRRHGWAEEDLLRIAPLVDAIEVFNARCMRPEQNRCAADFARRLNIAGTVGSDAHTLREVGRATMTLPEFHNAETLKTVIRSGKMDVIRSSPLIHLSSFFAKRIKKLQMNDEKINK